MRAHKLGAADTQRFSSAAAAAKSFLRRGATPHVSHRAYQPEQKHCVTRNMVIFSFSDRKCDLFVSTANVHQDQSA